MRPFDGDVLVGIVGQARRVDPLSLDQDTNGCPSLTDRTRGVRSGFDPAVHGKGLLVVDLSGAVCGRLLVTSDDAAAAASAILQATGGG